MVIVRNILKQIVITIFRCIMKEYLSPIIVHYFDNNFNHKYMICNILDTIHEQNNTSTDLMYWFSSANVGNFELKYCSAECSLEVSIFLVS